MFRQYELTIKKLRLLDFNESNDELFLDHYTLFASDVTDDKIYFEDNFIERKYQEIEKLDPYKYVKKVKNNKDITYYLIREYMHTILLNEELFNKFIQTVKLILVV
jgi:hypothetical protein